MAGIVRPPAAPVRRRLGPEVGAAARFHGGERGADVVRDAAGQAGMHADRGVEVRIGEAHDGRLRAARRESGDEDAPRVHGVVAHHFPGDAGDQRGLAAAAPLVARVEPVPALLGVGGGGLPRIGDQQPLVLRERVHARAGGEVVRRLGAAVEHDQQRRRLPAIGARDVELVGAGSGLVGEGTRDELRPFRHRRRPRWPRWCRARRFGAWGSGRAVGPSLPPRILSRRPRNASGSRGSPAQPEPASSAAVAALWRGSGLGAGRVPVLSGSTSIMRGGGGSRSGVAAVEGRPPRNRR